MELAVRGKYALFFDHDLKFHFIKDPLVIVEGNRIAEIDTYSKAKESLAGHDIIGDQNQLILPGFINAHTHISMTLFRGLADDIPLLDWLQKHIWPLEAKLSSADVYHGAILGIIESLLAGVTTFNSMYWHPEQEIRAMQDTSIRGMVGAPFITGTSNLSTVFDIARKFHDTANGKIRVNIAPHAPYTVTVDDYKALSTKLQEFNANSTKPPLLMHTHLAEPDGELEQAKQLNDEHNISLPSHVKSSVELLDAIGLLTDRLLAAHCIHVSEHDIQLLKSNGVRIALNPLSNSKLGNFMPPIPQILQAGIVPGLGTDGPASNNTLSILDTMRYLALYYKGALHDPTILNTKEVFKMATIGGALALDWKGIGTLEKGSFADIITMNLFKPHLTPIAKADTVLSHVTYSANGADVQNVVVDGKLVLENRTFTIPIDIAEAINNVQQTIEKLLLE